MFDSGHFDGRCAVPSPFRTRDGLHFRCMYECAHSGDHSWEKYRAQFIIQGGVFRSDVIAHCHPVPEGCTCRPIRQSGESMYEDGKIVDWLFSADCPVHTPKRA